MLYVVLLRGTTTFIMYNNVNNRSVEMSKFELIKYVYLLNIIINWHMSCA